MQATKTYVYEDDHGVRRVGRTRVMLDSVIAAFYQGHSPETIAEQYPALTLEDVYGSIAYYLANREETDRYLERQDAIWSHWREKANRASPVVARLRSESPNVGRSTDPE